ncbi:MAG: hypothetical protein C4293_08465 [Nitrospiraceae bacterium]
MVQKARKTMLTRAILSNWPAFAGEKDRGKDEEILNPLKRPHRPEDEESLFGEAGEEFACERDRFHLSLPVATSPRNAWNHGPIT